MRQLALDEEKKRVPDSGPAAFGTLSLRRAVSSGPASGSGRGRTPLPPPEVPKRGSQGGPVFILNLHSFSRMSMCILKLSWSFSNSYYTGIDAKAQAAKVAKEAEEQKAQAARAKEMEQREREAKSARCEMHDELS